MLGIVNDSRFLLCRHANGDESCECVRGKRAMKNYPNKLPSCSEL